MREKRLIVGLVLLVVGITLAIYFLSDGRTDSKPSSDVPAEKAQTENQQREDKLEQIKKLQKQDPNKAKELAKEMYETLSEKTKRHYTLGFEEGIEDVVFHGRVIDQHGEGVAGVRVAFEVGGRYLAGGSGRGALLTDNDGSFQLRGEGGSLQIRSIEHPDIDFHFPLATDGRHMPVLGFWGYQHTEGGNDLIWSDYTEEKPYTFRVWRKSSGSLATKLHQDDLALGFSCDGSLYTFDFTPREVAKRIIKGEAEGQLRIRYHCKAKQFSRDRGDWSVDIEAVNGGIQETEDLYLNLAPEEGYLPVYKLAMKKDEPGYQARVVKQFYFTAHDGKFYGSFIAEFYPYSYDTPRIFVDYKVNPTGSRALLSRKSR